MVFPQRFGTLEELAILRLIYKNPSIKQKELAAETGKSLSTVKRIMESLQKKDYIEKHKAQGRQMNLRAYGVPQNKTKSKKKDAKETVPNGNYLWINQFATALNDTGRAALVMANSASDAGNSEKDIRIKLLELWGMNIRTVWRLKKLHVTDREMTTLLFLLRCVKLGISIRDLDLLTIGMVNDMFVESRNDEYKGWRQVATQEDFDRF